ncbi:hypothetical protein KCMC57_up00630 [Kitasatospora sp. CMC57]|uniref:Uncharacterized protein n=1 Tax=Kitasatospora sp. CMC57 TaxID=3231513 RepID=A0AB33JQW6_9ACTN
MPISQCLEVQGLGYMGVYNLQLAIKFGFHTDPRQIDELVQLFRVGGRIIGVQDKYNLRTLDQCDQVLADAVRYRAPSDEGITLSHSIFDWLDRKVAPGAGAIGASIVRMLDSDVADVLQVEPNPLLDVPVATLGPYPFRPAYEVQLKFPVLVPIHQQMFKAASQVIAWYAVDFRD